MVFSISAYVSRPFLELSMEAVDRLAGVLASATDGANRERPRDADVLAGAGRVPRVEVGPVRVGPARASDARLHWRSPDGELVAEGVLRLLPVEGGAEKPMTELLLQGTWSTDAARELHPVGWARRVLELAAAELTTQTQLTSSTG